MKKYRLHAMTTLVLLCLTFGAVLAQDVPPEPSVNRPPLVECVAGANAPCSEIVDEVGDLVGLWRGYVDGGTTMGFTVFTDDGDVGTALNPQAEPTLTRHITFTDGLAYIAANEGSTVPVDCVTPGIYVMRLIRLGDQPVALTYRPAMKDDCSERAADFRQPMLSYNGTGAELPKLDADVDARAQPLVPCSVEGADDAQIYPCDVVVTQPKAVTGIWTQYVVPPMTGAAFIRYHEDGSWVFAGTPEDTAALSSSFDNGMVSFEQALATFAESGGCPPGEYYLRVIRLGSQPVALSYTALNDEACGVRWSAWADPMLWISGV